MPKNIMTNGICKTSFIRDSGMSDAERDIGFCSGGEEDYFETEIHSPTDSSEDSVEVKVSPICSRNKRKCAEPRKVPETFTGPLKKRMCLKVKSENQTTPEPFRPWSANPNVEATKIGAPLEKTMPFLKPPEFARIIEQKPTTSYFRPPSPPPKSFGVDQEPVALIKRIDDNTTKSIVIKSERNNSESPRVPIHPQISTLSPIETERLILNSVEAFPKLQNRGKNEPQYNNARKEQRNYKNMTRERRIEANARERTRVHTISAAFDTLRRSIPSYSHNQKLSKLSVLRIACAYIMTLSTIVEDSDSSSSTKPSTSECVEIVTRTIQREGKLRKKKDDGD